MTPKPENAAAAEQERDNYAKHLDLDVLVIGGGYSGCYLLHRLRERGYRVKIFDNATGLGGTWKWNQYPGARVDSYIPVYELSIPQVWKDWNWTERFPGWEEIQAYFEHLDKQLHISQDTAFNTKVISGAFDTATGRWTVRTEDGRTCTCKYLLPCVGFAAKRYVPEWKNYHLFKGTICHSSHWPKEDFDVSGKRCAVVGTGSTGVQITQEWAKRAKSLVVFQRTPNLALPMKQCKWTPAQQRELKEVYGATIKRRETGFSGNPFSYLDKKVFDDSAEEREQQLEQLWNLGDFNFWVGTYSDIFLDPRANRAIYDFWAKKQRERIHDQRKRDLLVPLEPPHPFGTKRPSLEQDYYDMFNKDSVDVVPIKQNPIVEVRENGIVLQDGSFYEVDVIAVATGFDAVTGSLINTGIRDIHGNSLQGLWQDGVKTYFGISIHDFPNMFFTYGPQAPTAFSNGPTLIEMQSDFIVDVIDKLQTEHVKYVNPTKEAQDGYVETIHALADVTLFPLADSWYMGANIPGKKREMLNYLGGVPKYHKELRSLVANDLPGFEKHSDGSQNASLAETASSQTPEECSGKEPATVSVVA